MDMINKLDFEILRFSQNLLQHSFLTPIFRFISVLGDHGSIWLLIIIILMLNKKTRSKGLYVFLAYGLCLLITNGILKNVIGRGRPFDLYDEIIPLINKPLDYSFPSGHTAMAFTISILLYRLLDKRVGLFMIVLATFMGFSRLYLGVHFLSDILGGIIVGWLISKFVCWLYQKQQV